MGTGGADLRVSAGHGRVVYAMKISDVLNLKQYFTDCRFTQKKIKSSVNLLPEHLQRDRDNTGRRVLIAKEFYYFGRQAVKIPKRFLVHPLEKRGPGFRYRNFDASFIMEFGRSGIEKSSAASTDFHAA